MSATDRQNRLLVAEDWKRIYQSFRNADFQSYDFENLRRVMINYIRENYPEDFNDYIESSEYIALIELIAFLGQSISFRVDLNSRDNFLELAERRESVLRLARLLSYNPKRNIAASGLLKFTSVQTTQYIIDSNGRNLAGQLISWNDPSNQNWQDQFLKVINAALPSSSQYGNPIDKNTIYGIPTEQYRFQSNNKDVPIYPFSKNIDGRNMAFEVVSTSFTDSNEIYEEPPSIGNKLAFLYRDDGHGTGSTNTGFFIHFRQGILGQGTFNISQPSTNESVDINAINVNNSDVWLYRLDQNGKETEYWEKVPSLEGNNIIYNSLSKSIKNIYSVITKAGDRISLLFSDGTFGTLPRGSFRVYYRASNGISYTINPRDIRNVSLTIPYTSHTGQLETLTVTMSLTSSVANASAAESSDSIKTNAPATYYTQNRMITGEDYNISPLSVNQEVIKIKSVNRTSSGISRYFDLADPTGKYSKTNLFSDDGAIYKEEYTDNFRFSYLSKTDIEAVIYNQVKEAISSIQLRDYYYTKYTKTIPTQSFTWVSESNDTNLTTGYFRYDGTKTTVGSVSTSVLKYATVGSLIQFTAPDGKYFNKNNNNAYIELTPAEQLISSNYTKTLWMKVINVIGNGNQVYLNDVIPVDEDNIPVVTKIIPAFRSTIDTNSISTMIELIYANKPFGLRYDTLTQSWKIIYEVNLNTADDFDTIYEGDTSNQQYDSSWLLLFTTDTEFYTVKQRLLRYVFESDIQTRFFYDSSDKIYDIKTNSIVKDKIKILSINHKPNSIQPLTYDREWEISEEYVGLDGYIDSKKIQVTFSDSDDDGVVDNPELFDEVVDIRDETHEGYVVLKLVETENTQDYVLALNTEITILDSQSDFVANSSLINKYFYFIDIDTVKKYDGESLVVSTDYKVYSGRRDIKFQYIHNADYDSRIDPGVTNIMDIYVLTKQYDTLYRQYVNNTISSEPLPPSTDYLYNLLAPELNKIKSLSDEIVYHPVKFKVLFGEKATSDVKAIFKIIKNSEMVISDNDIKSQVLSAINEFFNLENWDFGDSFYFSELTTYVMNKLTPYLVNFIIVPKQSELSFGSLFEIKAEKDQIFINGATIDDIEIISSITSSKIKSTGTIETTTSVVSFQAITSMGNN